jgi:hypothetical protein
MIIVTWAFGKIARLTLNAGVPLLIASQGIACSARQMPSAVYA